MKSFEIIQIVNKAGKILSKIVFIISLLGMIACMIGLLILKYGDFKAIEIGNITIHGSLVIYNLLRIFQRYYFAG